MKRIKVIYSWTKKNLLKMIICNGRPTKTQAELKEEILRENFKKKGDKQ